MTSSRTTGEPFDRLVQQVIQNARDLAELKNAIRAGSPGPSYIGSPTGLATDSAA